LDWRTAKPEDYKEKHKKYDEAMAKASRQMGEFLDGSSGKKSDKKRDFNDFEEISEIGSNGEVTDHALKNREGKVERKLTKN
jgi:hypothetical protein